MGFDAVHFKGAAGLNALTSGYRFETNQAFFPFFPYMINNTL